LLDSRLEKVRKLEFIVYKSLFVSRTCTSRKRTVSFLFKNGYHIFTMQAPPIHKPEDQLQLEMTNGWY
jgi:hypothetical protein